MLYTTTFMFKNLDFIHTRICYGFLNENNHQEYSVLFVIVDLKYTTWPSVFILEFVLIERRRCLRVIF
jgi:hypothetical protein